jgi:hypothetical protein
MKVEEANSQPSTCIETRASVGHARAIKACFSYHYHRLPLFGGTTTIPRCRSLSFAVVCAPLQPT